MRFHLKEVGKTPQETAEIMATSVIANRQVQDYALTKLKFEVAYFVAKEEMPLSKYPQLLKLQEKHGVEIRFAYRSDMNCGTFIDFMGEELGLKLHQKLSTAHFYSILIVVQKTYQFLKRSVVCSVFRCQTTRQRYCAGYLIIYEIDRFKTGHSRRNR